MLPLLAYFFNSNATLQPRLICSPSEAKANLNCSKLFINAKGQLTDWLTDGQTDGLNDELVGCLTNCLSLSLPLSLAFVYHGCCLLFSVCFLFNWNEFIKPLICLANRRKCRSTRRAPTLPLTSPASTRVNSIRVESLRVSLAQALAHQSAARFSGFYNNLRRIKYTKINYSSRCSSQSRSNCNSCRCSCTRLLQLLHVLHVKKIASFVSARMSTTNMINRDRKRT